MAASQLCRKGVNRLLAPDAHLIAKDSLRHFCRSRRGPTGTTSEGSCSVSIREPWKQLDVKEDLSSIYQSLFNAKEANGSKVPLIALTMEPALDVLHRALQGDEAARSFLDRTSSIYILDATDITRPHTYGCWNFIHQAMNEIERTEGNLHRTSTAAHSSSMQFVAHAQLLATMALRVARRSNILDKQLVATCIGNASTYHGSASDAQKLIDINVEIRDIVMGRLAALALDPSFHRNTKAGNYVSAFSDTVVLETFCAVLAANAVSNGPAAVRHLVSEWIVPSSKHLPPFCLTCVTLHLAEEAARREAPSGIQDTLQQLSTLVMAVVLAPVLTEAIKESAPEAANTKVFLSNGLSVHEMNCRIAALSLRAMNHWCAVTDLSLAQIKHICTKAQINIVDTLNDAMYSDSRLVVDALAEFMECVMERHQVVTVSEQRMTQVRYIMQVDEDSFRTHITAEQLVTIESKEMAVILDELVSSIGLQRFRFTERQNNGDLEVCRNLARMGASICDACHAVSTDSRPVKIGPGLLDLLLKAAAHQSTDISGIALEVLNDEISSETGLFHQLLPILQGRAITPHTFLDGDVPSLVPPEDQSDFEGCEAFYHYRETSLTECLQACWEAQPDIYMSSCVSAIEEFSRPQASHQLSFHLEAALFCISAITQAEKPQDMTKYIAKCIAAFALKPTSLTSNPLTLSQACKFIHKYASFLATCQIEGALDVAADLALSTFNLCATNFPYEDACANMRRDGNVSPFSDAAKAMEALMIHAPQHFVSNQSIAVLGSGWEASYAAANQSGILAIDDRESLCTGICHVLASLPVNQQGKSLLALAMPSLDCIELMLQHANESIRRDGDGTKDLNAILDRLASEMIIVSTIATSFSKATAKRSDTSSLNEPAVNILKRAWSVITIAATKFNDSEAISKALSRFLSSSVPDECNSDLAMSLLEELCHLANSIIENRKTNLADEWSFRPTLSFVGTIVERYGRDIDQYARSNLIDDGNHDTQNHHGNTGSGDEERSNRIVQSLEGVLLGTVDAVQSHLGNTWTNAQRQGNGQAAFESKSVPLDPSSLNVSNSALASMVSLLRTCAVHCPVFLLRLPAAKDQDRNEDILLRRAIESAVASILDLDGYISSSCMEFLESLFQLTTERRLSDPVLQQTMEEMLLRVRQDILNAVVLGMCGKFGTSPTVVSASRLLHSLLRTYSSRNEADCRSNLSTAFSTTGGYFLLGLKAQMVIGDYLFRYCQREESTGTTSLTTITATHSHHQHYHSNSSTHAGIPPSSSLEELQGLMEHVWDLHHSDSPDALPESDSVARFCLSYHHHHDSSRT